MTNTNTLKTHEPHHPALSEASTLLCSVGSSKTVLCGEDSYWDKKGGAPNILHNNNAVDASTRKPRAFEDNLREALRVVLRKKSTFLKPHPRKNIIKGSAAATTTLAPNTKTMATPLDECNTLTIWADLRSNLMDDG
jgi:hypothetical protein